MGPKLVNVLDPKTEVKPTKSKYSMEKLKYILHYKTNHLRPQETSINTKHNYSQMPKRVFFISKLECPSARLMIIKHILF